MAFIAFLDANVLYPATLRDVLLSIAEAGVCQIRWSPDVLDEMERNVAVRASAPSSEVAAAGARYLREAMERAFPEAMVERASYGPLIPVMRNAGEDRHVLAAAVVARADVLVTFNVWDFPPEACAPYGIEVQEPDRFLVHQFGLIPDQIADILRALVAERRRPPMDTLQGILQALQSRTPHFCAMVLRHLERTR